MKSSITVRHNGKSYTQKLGDNEWVIISCVRPNGMRKIKIGAPTAKAPMFKVGDEPAAQPVIA